MTRRTKFVRKQAPRKAKPMNPVNYKSLDERVLTAVRLHFALQRERVRGEAGHWTYNLAQHLALADQFKAAMQEVKAANLEKQFDGMVEAVRQQREASRRHNDEVSAREDHSR